MPPVFKNPHKFSVGTYDAQHKKNLSTRAKKVERLYTQAIQKIAAAAQPSLFGGEEGQQFTWRDFPQLDKEITALQADLAKGLQMNIEQGDEESWQLANAKNDAMVASLVGRTKIPKDVLQTWNDTHLRAMKSFIERREGGMGLSQRVWNLTGQFKDEMELALETCIGKGMSAADISREVRQYLQYPDKLFRRVRDEKGVLRLSKAAAAFHPGQGVYRSSYKNALRMTATENNMAYRSADHERWGSLPFVIGIEIRTSNNHPVTDICDELQGRYPKDFKFVGWHPWCRCFAVSVLADQKQMDAYTQAIMNGEDVTNWKFKGEVKEMPKEWNTWMKANAERINQAMSRGKLPYFIKDNFTDGDPTKGLRWMNQEPAKPKPQPKPEPEPKKEPTFKERMKNGETVEQLVARMGEDTPVTLQNFAERLKHHAAGDYERDFLTEGQVRMLRTAIADTVNGSDFGMLIEPDVLEKIMLTHFKNQMETRTSGGVLNDATRKRFSRQAFGTPKTAAPEEYEKYGCLLDKDKKRSLATSNGSQYGDVEIRFKKDKVVTTFTMDDSLDTSWSITPSLTTDPKAMSVHFDSSLSESDTVRRIYKAGLGHKEGNTLEGLVDAMNSSYIELQYHGMLTAEHVESITFQSLAQARRAKKGVKLAAEKGIDIFYLEDGEIKKLTRTEAKKL